MREIGIYFFFLGLSLFVIWSSLRLDIGTLQKTGPGAFPFCAGVIMAALSLMSILRVRDWRLRESKKHFPRPVIMALASLFVYSLVLETLGFIVATFFLVGILFRLGEPRRWWVLFGMSALVTFLVYLVFDILLHVYFPRGFLGI